MSDRKRSVTLTDADRLDYCYRLERECIHILLLEDALRGFEDVLAGRTSLADSALAEIKERRALTVKRGGRNAR